MKKAQFFIAIMMNELGWVVSDPENLSSPVDYHELRGHLRIGTVFSDDATIASKIEKGLPLTVEEDIEIRQQVQKINDFIARETGLSSSVVHYLFWNVFRNCCPQSRLRLTVSTVVNGAPFLISTRRSRHIWGNAYSQSFVSQPVRSIK